MPPVPLLELLALTLVLLVVVLAWPPPAPPLPPLPEHVVVASNVVKSKTAARRGRMRPCYPDDSARVTRRSTPSISVPLSSSAETRAMPENDGARAPPTAYNRALSSGGP
jgi:hypothetical protein